MKIAFNSDNKEKSDFDFPKLTLEVGEKARIAIVEAEPEAYWVHELRSPQIINGQAVMTKAKTKSGEEYDTPAMDFLARVLCLGQPNVLAEKGKDPSTCPVCAAANDSDYVAGTKRRFAMNVLKYKTQPGSFTIQDPFSAEVLVWGFTNQRFDQLVEIATEHKDLRAKDLLLGPCQPPKMYQKFDMQPGSSSAWQESEETKSHVTRLYQNNRVEDLMPAIGRKVTRDKAEEYIDQILMKSRQAFGGAGEAVSPSLGGSEVGTALDLDSMLGGDSKPAADLPAETPAGESAAWDTVIAEKEAVSVPDEPKPATSPMDFDELMKGI